MGVIAGDDAAVLEPPFARGADRAVDPARARRMRRDDAGPARIERVGNLYQERDVLLAAAVVGVSDVLASGDLAFGRGHVAVYVDIGAVQRPVSAGRGDVEHGAIVGIDRAAAQ